MPATPLPWPPALDGTPTVTVIERAINRQRLAHSLLLHGENLGTLAIVAHAIADRLLNDPRHNTQNFPPKQHPDFHALRPAGKMRLIDVGSTRELIGKMQISCAISTRKVAVIYEADRMNTPAANVFLKTLEEPTPSTTILLLTTRPYALLPTIRSRCLHFRFTDSGSEALIDADEATQELWRSTRTDYAAWLQQLAAGKPDKRTIADQVMGVYGLITRFNAILGAATETIWKTQQAKLPDDLDDDEQIAIETGIANGIRQKLFIEIEQATRTFAQERLLAGDDSVRRALTASIEKLEHNAGLLRVNFNESAAFEDFLLTSLRLWSMR
ncbi:MAG: DNA polymerase III subunit gamma/tau [Opitutaceae bacterium]|nr:DNA polymerase III subunit gamma/tau [Opitutaceae bacterium]